MIEVDEQILKPANLTNSAVLKALEEEEMEKHQSAYKRVAWPPAADNRPTPREFTPQPQQFSQPPNQGANFNQTYTEPQVQYQPQSHQPHYNYQHPQQQTQPQHQSYPSHPPSGHRNVSIPPQSAYPQHHEHQVPIVVEGNQTQPQGATPLNRWGHVRSPLPTHTGYTNQQPGHYSAQQQVPPQQGLWQGQSQTSAPAPSAPTYQNFGVNNYHQQQQPTPSIGSQYQHQSVDQVDYSRQPLSQEQQQQYRYSQPPESYPQQYSNHSQGYRGESPGIITLRKEAPFHQRPSPVYSAQPAAAKFGGGANMRGDLKWPPPEYKQQAVAENEERRKIALGPVCRPRRVNKDYSAYFAKNALNSFYPGYRVPPGTQHIQAQY